MKANELDKNFGITSTQEEERKKFINRVEQVLFDWMISVMDKDSWDALYKHLCFDLGERFEEVQRKYPWPSFNKMPVQHLTESDFHTTLKMLVSMSDYYTDMRVGQYTLSQKIEYLLSLSTVDLGIRFSNGQFYPSGEKLLDKDLIDFSLDSLTNYPEENKHLKNALKHYAAKDLVNTLSDCYLCMEGLVRKILKNEKRLDVNKEELLTLLGFSQEWKRILIAYIDFINEYGRHASKNQKNIKQTEVESGLYQTCLLIRAIVNSIP